tara:strand:- start:8 stop:211 length:204 start_codon:yes stop_codon:yes gene_type:complete
MNLKSFLLVLIGVGLLGVSAGYVLGFYLHRIVNENYWFYLSVPIMAISSFMIMYGALFSNKKEKHEK